MNQLELRMRLNQAKQLYEIAEVAWMNESREGNISEETIDALITFAQAIIEITNYLENTDEEDYVLLKSVYVRLGELLYNRHEKRIRRGSTSEEDYNKLMYAQECFEKGLPLSKAQYVLDDVVVIVKSIMACQHLFTYTKDIKYVTLWHDTACQTFEKSRQVFSGSQARSGFNQTLIESIITGKCMLSDFDGAESYIAEYIMSGVKQQEVDYIRKFVQQKREQARPKSEPKRKKLFGLF